MTTQTQTTEFNNLIFVLMPEEPVEMPTQYTVYDLGLEIALDEMENALMAEYSNGSFDQPTPQFEPAEFETIYYWFLS